jgi:hypothetical protein
MKNETYIVSMFRMRVASRTPPRDVVELLSHQRSVHQEGGLTAGVVVLEACELDEPA